MQRIKKNKIELLIFSLAILYRMPTLGYDFINSDAFHWKERGYAFGSALTSLDFAGTAVTYHPGVPLLWSQFIANKIFSLLSTFGFYGDITPRQEFFINHFWQKFVLVIITSFIIAWIFRKLKVVIGKNASIGAVLLILLEPFYLGLSRAIHTDVLLSLFMFLSFLYFFEFTNIISSNQREMRKKIQVIVWSGIFVGLASLTKSSGLFLIPFFGLWTVFDFFKFKDKRFVLGYIQILFFAVLTFFVLWPAMWVSPLSSLNLYFFEGIKGVAIQEGHGHTWFGVETTDPGALFYPVVLIARYSFVLISLAVGGLIYWVKSRRKLDRKLFDFVQANFIYALLYIFMVTIVSKKLDRYSLPVVFPLGVIASYYAPKVFSKKTFGALVAAFVISRAVLLYGLHPNYLAYYSPLVGGVEGGRYIVEPKWVIGYNKLAKFFNEKENPQNIKVAVSEHDYLRPFAVFQVLNIRHDVERDTADYFVLPVYRKKRNQFYLDNYDLEKLRDVITVAGVEYYKIYKVKGKR